MPNWTNNMVQIIGTPEQINKVKNVLGEQFNFNTIYPMPESLSIASPSDEAAFAYALYVPVEERESDPLFQVFRNKFGEKALSYNSDGSSHDYRLDRAKNRIERLHGTDTDIPNDLSFIWMETGNHNLIDTIGKFRGLGAVYLNNILLYGYSDWYDWCCYNWGTKWNACEGQFLLETLCDGRIKLEYTFNTAWCMPYGIANKLALMFPDVLIIWAFIGEDTYGDNQGWFIKSEGYSGYVENFIEEDNLRQEWAGCDWLDIETWIYGVEGILASPNNQVAQHMNEQEIDEVEEFLFV